MIGVGGMIDPRVLGVGYSTIDAELTGQLTIGALALLLVIKLAVWPVGLGSGTSGGILAPPSDDGSGHGWPDGADPPRRRPVSLGCPWDGGGDGRCDPIPAHGLVFAFELTHSTDLLLPLLLACALAHLVSTLTLKRSILTEKVARKGFHVVREYAVDPLEALFVRDVMRPEVVTVERFEPLSVAYDWLAHDPTARRQHVFPIIDEDGALTGSISWDELHDLHWAQTTPGSFDDLLMPTLGSVDPDETLRHVADRMASTSLSALVVVADHDSQTLRGVITVEHLLAARQRLLVEERHRERPLRLRSRRRSDPQPTRVR